MINSVKPTATSNIDVTEQSGLARSFVTEWLSTLVKEEAEARKKGEANTTNSVTTRPEEVSNFRKVPVAAAIDSSRGAMISATRFIPERWFHGVVTVKAGDLFGLAGRFKRAAIRI